MIDQYDDKMNVTVAVTQGIEWLNENGPAGWWERINLDVLALSSPWDCVLGQVFAADADTIGVASGYLYAIDHLDRELNWSVQSLGFCGSGRMTASELRDEWAHQITELRALVNG